MTNEEVNSRIAYLRNGVKNSGGSVYVPNEFMAVLLDKIDGKVVLADFYAEVCAEAERTIALTGMVSGAHWNAMKVVLKRKGVQIVNTVSELIVWEVGNTGVPYDTPVLAWIRYSNGNALELAVVRDMCEYLATAHYENLDAKIVFWSELPKLPQVPHD